MGPVTKEKQMFVMIIYIFVILPALCSKSSSALVVIDQMESVSLFKFLSKP